MLFVKTTGVIEPIFLGNLPSLEPRSNSPINLLNILRDLIKHIPTVLDNPLLLMFEHHPCLFEFMT